MTEPPAVIPVFVVLPPRTLLLDVAGPLEVLRRATFEPGAPGFAVTYVAARPSVESSIGLTLAGIQPLPEALPDGALVIVSGNVDQVLGGEGASAADAEDEAAIVAWLARAVRPGVTLACICSGSLLA
ncbi:AraC family transcriptional regulator, partial [Caulobacter sp. D4A]